MTAEEVAYAESARALEQQTRSLDELRSRTSVLVATASIAGSVLGVRAISGDAGTWSVLALIAFGLVIVLALVVLWPRKGWEWSMRPRDVLQWARPDLEGQTAAMQAFLACAMEDGWDANRSKLRWLFIAYQVAIVCRAAELLFWTLELAERG